MAERVEYNSSVYDNLVDAGCDAHLVERFFALQSQGRSQEQRCLLSAHRQMLLDGIHQLQRRLDCLDVLLYRMRKENQGKRGK